MIIFSVFILFRGHNYPGGGFIGGILAGSGILYDALANTIEKVHNYRLVKPFRIFTLGLIICLLASLAGMFFDNSIFQGYWTGISIPLFGEIKLGTPLLFDVGIYLAVMGSYLLIIYSIMEELEWK